MRACVRGRKCQSSSVGRAAGRRLDAAKYCQLSATAYDVMIRVVDPLAVRGETARSRLTALAPISSAAGVIARRAGLILLVAYP